MLKIFVLSIFCLSLVCGENSERRQVTGGIEAVRLVNGTTERDGLLLVQSQGAWGTVCDDGFNKNAAIVVCRSLGFLITIHSVVLMDMRPTNTPSEAILLDDVLCSGSESSLNECTHLPIGQHNCQHNEDVSINCDGPQIDIRLAAGNSPRDGRVEVMYENTWGTICDDNFDQNDADVVCRMLGFGNLTAKIIPISDYGHGSGQIWLDELSCPVTADHLINCTHRGWGTNDCSHSEDVAVACGNVVTNIGRIRLSDGNSTYGRAEIFNRGQWGTICDDAFNNNAATVFCRMMGRSTGVFDMTRVSPGTGPIWLAGVVCQGDEASLNDCRSESIGHYCVHDEDVWIRCD